MVRVPGNTRFHDDVRIAAKAFAHEAMVYRTCRQERVHRQLALLQVAITQHQDQLAVANRLHGLIADLLERHGQGSRFIDIEVNELVVVAVHVFA